MKLRRMFSRTVATAGAADLPVMDMTLSPKPLSASDIEDALEQLAGRNDYRAPLKEVTGYTTTSNKDRTNYCLHKNITEEKPCAHEYEFDFPEEVLHKVFSFLDYVTLCKVCSVSKWWKAVANDSRLWKDLTELHFYRHVPAAKEPNWKQEFERKSRSLGWLSKGAIDVNTLRSPSNSETSPVTALHYDEISLLSGSSSEAFEWDFNEEMWIGRTCDNISEVEKVHIRNTFTYAVSDGTVRAWFQADLYGLGKSVLVYTPKYQFANFSGDYFAIFQPNSHVLVFKHNEKISVDNVAKVKAEIKNRSADIVRPPQRDDDDDDDEEDGDDESLGESEDAELNAFEDELNDYQPYGIGRADKMLKIDLKQYLGRELIFNVFIQDKRNIVIVVTKKARLFIFDLSSGELLRTVQCLRLRRERQAQFKIKSKVIDIKCSSSGLLCIRHNTTKKSSEGNILSKEQFMSIYDINRQVLMVDSDRSAYAFNDGIIDRVEIVGHFRSSFVAVSSVNRLQVWQIYRDKLLLTDSFEIGNEAEISAIKATRRLIAAGTTKGDIMVHIKRRPMTNCCIM